MRRRRLATDLRLLLLTLSCAVPMLLLSVAMFVGQDWHPTIKIAVVMVSAIWVLVAAFTAREGLLRSVRTLSNMIEATRVQDYSLRGSGARESGELARLYEQINALAAGLGVGRQREHELLTVLEKIVAQISVAIVVCDAKDRIQLANPYACRLLQSDAESLVGTAIAGTALADIPPMQAPQLFDHRFPGGEGRWQVVQQEYRHQGLPSRIIFITDLKQVLFDEEIAAWRRLIRVISHEVNNSLTPITSLGQTLAGLLDRHDSSAHMRNVIDGLHVINQRARGLKEFVSAYARIARLPEPQKQLFEVLQLIGKLQRIFPAPRLELRGGVPDIQLYGDPVHLEQALINLIKNALEANEHSSQPVLLACGIRDAYCEFEVLDNGPGIRNPQNLFVPFYTTKGEGAGIGLVLCRQIAAQHHGDVALENRSDAQGAIARLRLPLPARQRSA